MTSCCRLDFKVLSESGNYNHWKYSVEYTEQLSHWPHLFNTAVASFDVLPDLQNGSFYVHSLHTTCLFGGYFCCKLRHYHNLTLELINLQLQ